MNWRCAEMSKTRVWIPALVLWGMMANLWAANEKGGHYSLLAMGTSLTANYSWPRLLAEKLGRCLGVEIKVEVVARAGENSRNSVAQFVGRQLMRPSIVLIEYATNDADWLDGISLYESRANHTRLFRRIHEESPQSNIVLMTMSPALGLRGWLRPHLDSYYDMYQELADMERIAIVDTRKAWQSYLKNPADQGALSDGLHPSEAATKQVLLPILLLLVGNTLSPDTRPDCSQFLQGPPN
jgi:acyl-CoA thioesterase-1